MNIIITWPKTRPLRSYVEECAEAERRGLHINFRVPTKPEVTMGDRCYVVYSGFIHGYHKIVAALERDDVIDPISGETMRAGIYIVRNALYFPNMGKQHGMRGFQGWRYAKPPL